MRAPSTESVARSEQAYRAIPEPEGDSSNSNSPARLDYKESDYEESDFYAANNDSQSSIGVPTFQDMAVSQEECGRLPLSPAAKLPAEVLISIFAKLTDPADLLSCICVSKLWARNCVDQLWHRPNCTTWNHHRKICHTLTSSNTFFPYKNFVKRLNLAQLAQSVNDGSVLPLSGCDRVERLTLTKCIQLTDQGLVGLLEGSRNLLALDISEDDKITGVSMEALARNCPGLQGLNVMGCTEISNEAFMFVARSCTALKRIKLNNCFQLSDEAVLEFAQYCPSILEIDLQNCRLIGNEPITALLQYSRFIREYRLVGCDGIDDTAFLSLPVGMNFEYLRILDMTSCHRITDRTVEKIVDAAPRLRNLVFAKCRLLTDQAVYAISKLGKNLHYLHLGHCSQITDPAVIKLVQQCNRIRYIDLGCCVHLTDASVMKLATLPKLRRIGLVKCSNITDESVYALAQRGLNARNGARIDGRIPGHEFWQAGSSLERVHLSYCINLTMHSIITLLNNCQKLTHLSLTGVQAFLRDDLEQFCRAAPPEFTDHQRSVFCVFSSDGVSGLRNHLNQVHPDPFGPRPPSRELNPAAPAWHPLPTGPQPMAGVIPSLLAPIPDGDDADPDDDDDREGTPGPNAPW